jgi:LacI family transcriptional regulator
MLAKDLADILFGRGYQRPVLLNLPEAIVAAELRASGISDSARRNRVDMTGRIHTAVIEADGKVTFVADKVLSELMKRPARTRPDVIVCGQDILAMEVYFVLAELGLKVGKDVAVASFDNLEPIASLLKPGLSTMELPYYDMGRAAMLTAIDPPAGPAHTIRLSGRFVERASV